MKKCPFCAEDIQDAAVKCRFCSSQLNSIKKHKKPTRTHWYVTLALTLIALWWVNSLFEREGSTGQVAAQTQTQENKTKTDRIEYIRGNSAHNKIRILSNDEINSVFTKSLKGSSKKCDTVVRNFYEGHRENVAFWNIECKNNQAYVIHIGTNGNTISHCDDLKAFGVRECFKKLD